MAWLFDDRPLASKNAVKMRTNASKTRFFITFEGPEGSGKSTQLRMLAARLRAEGREVFETAEPGGTPIGIQIRRVLLDAKNQDMFPITELLLMFASRVVPERCVDEDKHLRAKMFWCAPLHFFNIGFP